MATTQPTGRRPPPPPHRGAQGVPEAKKHPKLSYHQRAHATPATAANGGLLFIDQVSGPSWTQNNTGLTAACTATRSNASALAVDDTVSPANIYWGSQTCGLLSRATSSTTWAVVASYTT